MPERGPATDQRPPRRQFGGRWSGRAQWRPAGAGHDGRHGGARWRDQLDPGTGLPFSRVLDLDAGQAMQQVQRVHAAYRPDALPPVAERASLLSAMAAAVERIDGVIGCQFAGDIVPDLGDEPGAVRQKGRRLA